MLEKSRRVDIKAILADPEQRQELLTGATSFLIGVGEDFQIENASARFRAEALLEPEPQVED